MSGLVLVAALVTMSLVSSPANAAGPWYVAPTGDDTNDCLSPVSPCATINGALAKPGFTAGDIINVAVGNYTGIGDEVVLLVQDVTLSGGWDVSFTTQSGRSTIDGENARRALTAITGVTASVDKFHFVSGFAPPHVSLARAYSMREL